jgi:hypothetical protein
MGYPETATGYLVKDQKNWTNFEKGEVGQPTFHQPRATPPSCQFFRC